VPALCFGAFVCAVAGWHEAAAATPSQHICPTPSHTSNARHHALRRVPGLRDSHTAAGRLRGGRRWLLRQRRNVPRPSGGGNAGAERGIPGPVDARARQQVGVCVCGGGRRVLGSGS
jgi:hypothetical protein